MLRFSPPRHIRSDNGTEFFAKKPKEHLKTGAVGALDVELGSPWQVGIAESFNGRLLDECLDREVFSCLREAMAVIKNFRRFSRDERPHRILDDRTHAAFAAACRQAPPLRSGSLHRGKHEVPGIGLGTEASEAR